MSEIQHRHAYWDVDLACTRWLANRGVLWMSFRQSITASGLAGIKRQQSREDDRQHAFVSSLDTGQRKAGKKARIGNKSTQSKMRENPL